MKWSSDVVCVDHREVSLVWIQHGPAMRWLGSLKRFLRSEDGPTSVEYCVMLALILLVVMMGVSATGGGVSGWWTDIDTELDTHGF